MARALRRRAVRLTRHLLPRRSSSTAVRSACRFVLALALLVVLCPTDVTGQNFEAVIRLPIRLGVDRQGEVR